MERDGIAGHVRRVPRRRPRLCPAGEQLAFTAISENFLAECLGGRAEPVGEVLGKSTAEIRTGKDYVKGLVTAEA